MNENEKNLFYKVLKENINKEPAPEMTAKIMHLVYKRAHKRAVTHKVLEILGYALLVITAVVFVGVYLYYYTDFTLPVLQLRFDMPEKIYIIIPSIIFLFLLVDLFFRRKLYQNS